jgi:hypothetical protein
VKRKMREGKEEEKGSGYVPSSSWTPRPRRTGTPPVNAHPASNRTPTPTPGPPRYRPFSPIRRSTPLACAAAAPTRRERFEIDGDIGPVDLSAIHVRSGFQGGGGRGESDPCRSLVSPD